MDVAINNIKTTITVPQVDFNLLKELAKKLDVYKRQNTGMTISGLCL